jgi:basic membrane protein A
MFKKILSTVLVVAMLASLCVAFASCGGSGSSESQPQGEGAITELTVGVILIGNEGEGYTKAHMDGIEAAVEAMKATGKTVNVLWKKDVLEDEGVATNAQNLIAEGASVIITNSYGHQFNMGSTVTDNQDTLFIHMTGDLAAGSAETNDFNAFTKVFESRYVSGVVAGLKLKSMIDAGTLTPENVPAAFDTDGNVKIGYVGAFNYAEVVSGYTAFYLGIKSVVDNVVMTVKYTNSWFDPNRESAAADYLMSQGCVIIGQHADSTGAPTAVQTKYEAGALYHFSVGYNVSMLDVAPDVALTSATNNWAVYYTELFTKIFAGEKPATDWAKGYADDAVAITALGTACAEGTADYVANVVASLKDGSLKVFDCSKFTKDGAHLTTYTEAWGMNGAECLKTENGVTFFDESTLRSAPYFDIRIDGITEEAYEG